MTKPKPSTTKIVDFCPCNNKEREAANKLGSMYGQINKKRGRPIKSKSNTSNNRNKNQPPKESNGAAITTSIQLMWKVAETSTRGYSWSKVI